MDTSLSSSHCDNFVEFSRQFLTDTFLALAYGGSSGGAKVGNDGVGITKIHTQATDEFLIIKVAAIK